MAQLGAYVLVQGSFVPPEPIRQLRDLTRARTGITRERGREAQRLEKLLEDAGIKLSAIASDILGVSGRQMLDALMRRGRVASPGPRGGPQVGIGSDQGRISIEGQRVVPSACRTGATLEYVAV